MRHRSDNSKAGIVKGLRKLGFIVEIIERPVDVAIRKNSWPDGLFLLAEIKTATKGGKIPHSPRQIAQRDFIAAHGCPYVTDLESAIAALPLL